MSLQLRTTCFLGSKEKLSDWGIQEDEESEVCLEKCLKVLMVDTHMSF